MRMAARECFSGERLASRRAGRRLGEEARDKVGSREMGSANRHLVRLLWGEGGGRRGGSVPAPAASLLPLSCRRRGGRGGDPLLAPGTRTEHRYTGVARARECTQQQTNEWLLAKQKTPSSSVAPRPFRGGSEENTNTQTRTQALAGFCFSIGRQHGGFSWQRPSLAPRKAFMEGADFSLPCRKSAD